MKTTKAKIISKYTFYGIIIGVTVWLILLIIDFETTNIPLNIRRIGYIHHLHPVWYAIDFFVFLLAFTTWYISTRFARSIDITRRISEHEIDKTKKVIDFVENASIGNFEINIDIAKNDELGKSILNLRDYLRKNKEEEKNRREDDEHRSWSTEGLAKFAEILRRDNNNMELLSTNVIQSLVQYLKANQGGFFILNKDNPDEKYFEMTACYAYERKKFAQKRIEWGEGLIGACALEMESIYMTDVPNNYVNITSGLGEATPRCIFIVPLKVNDILHGVIELASFTPLQIYELEFVEKLAASIASTIYTVKNNIQTARLLEDSQRQAEELALQEEKLRENIEELRATQEQAAIQGMQFENFVNSVNHTMITAEFSTEGTLLYANTKFLHKLGYEKNSDVEGKNISMFISDKDLAWFSKLWEELAIGGKHYEGDIKLVTKQGDDLWTMATYACMRNSDETVAKILYLGTDITNEKKKNLDYQGQINALNLSSLKAEFTPEGRIIDCNDIYLETLGYLKTEIEDKTVFEFIENSEQEAFKLIWEKIIEGEPHKDSLKLLTKDNTEKWFQSTYTSVNDIYGQVVKIIFIANDITEQKAMEFETKRQSEQLQLQDEKLRISQVELSKKLELAKLEMKDQFREIEIIKIRNEKTLEGALDAIVTFSQHGKIEFFNKAAESLWGLSKEEVLDKHIKILFSEETQREDDFVAAMVKSGTGKMVGTRREVKIQNTSGDNPVLILLSEAEVYNEYTYTAFIQNIEIELF